MSLEIVSVNEYRRPEDLLNVKDSIITNGVLKIGMLIARRYCEGAWELHHLTQMRSHVSILKWSYYACISRGLFKPIEELPEEQKRELWDTVRTEVDKHERVKSVLLDLTRVVHALIELSKLIYKEDMEKENESQHESTGNNSPQVL